MRPGRLDRILYVGPPDRQARKEILGIRLRGMAVDPTLDIDELADLVRAGLISSEGKLLTKIGRRMDALELSWCQYVKTLRCPLCRRISTPHSYVLYLWKLGGR